MRSYLSIAILMIIAALITMATYLLPVTAVWFAGIAPEQFSTGAWVDAAQNLVGYPLALALTPDRQGCIAHKMTT